MGGLVSAFTASEGVAALATAGTAFTERIALLGNVVADVKVDSVPVSFRARGTSDANWGTLIASLEPAGCFPTDVAVTVLRELSTSLSVPGGFSVFGTVFVRRVTDLFVSGDMLVDGGRVRLYINATLTVAGTLTTRNGASFELASGAQVIVLGQMVSDGTTTFTPAVFSAVGAGVTSISFPFARFASFVGPPITVKPVRVDITTSLCFDVPVTTQSATTLTATVAVQPVCGGGGRLSSEALVGVIVGTVTVAVIVAIALVIVMVQRRKAAAEQLRAHLVQKEVDQHYDAMDM